jgi:hypothetical protein
MHITGWDSETSNDEGNTPPTLDIDMCANWKPAGCKTEIAAWIAMWNLGIRGLLCIIHYPIYG